MTEVSEKFKKTFSVHAQPKAKKSSIFIKNNCRFTVLTARLLRVEYDRDGIFTDEMTQAVLSRDFDTPAYKITENGSVITVATAQTVFRYDIRKKKMLSVSLKGGDTVTDFKKGNLKGTYRTLDMVNGSTRLEDGLMSLDGVSVMDDSKTVIINPDGTISERRKCLDEYYFAYGHDYRACLRDFFRLSGSVPLVPRYCLGNWWSRYKAYTQDEYVKLMSDFIEREIPITVATIDMDWHWVDVEKRFGYKPQFNHKNPFELFQGQGWTGYSWNTELFPDYKKMFTWLKDNGLKITMNLHPAQGVRSFEDMYPEMAERMGIDPKTKKTVPFDIAAPKFIEAYCDVLHKPYENDGVDFWWIDWQQEKTTAVKGLDPLWALNHYHTLAFTGENKRPLILSRFAKVGSHRYPLGFSGDTIITWESLDFQPYFTITAANVGYTWWSHDIGGHHLGSRNDELYTRWVQFGEYSPINRLHSTSDEFMGKEPWKYSYSAEQIAVGALRERHAMIPYLYSMNYRTHKDGIALCEPMYYSYPEEKAAYEIKNEYFFGSELLVAPVTTPLNKTTNLAATKVWLPDGIWTDIYNGRIYKGGRTVTMYRGIESIPVLAKAGAILPLSSNCKTNDCSNPTDMTVRIFSGNNTFKLYEDDGETLGYQNGEFAVTKMKQRKAADSILFTVEKTEGDLSVTVPKRSYTFVFENVSDCREITVKAANRDRKFEKEIRDGKLTVTVKDVNPKNGVEVELRRITERKNRETKEEMIEILSKYQMITMQKKMLLTPFINDMSKPIPFKDKDLRGPVEEILNLG